MNKELKEKLLAFFNSCDLLKESKITVKEYISTNGNNFDRHFTTFSELEFRLINFGVRISGGRAMFIGNKQKYEIGGDMIIQLLDLGENEYELIEKYAEKVYRKSHLKFEAYQTCLQQASK